MKETRSRIIIFDVDGVLVDVRESFLRTLVQTVYHFTGKKVSEVEVHQWKNRSGFNDDWTLSHAWVNALGHKHSYAEVKDKFQEIYWGENNTGNVKGECWLLPKRELARLGKRAELDLFTGRVRQELDYTLGRDGLRSCFTRIVTAENVRHPKPNPEGLQLILDGRDPKSAVYLGDNVDDARAAQDAGVAFIGVLPYRSEARRQRAARLEAHGALALLGSVRQLEGWLEKRKWFDEAHETRLA